MRRVRDLMTQPVLVIREDKLLSEAAGILDVSKVSGAPLVDAAGALVGMISKSDITHFEFRGGNPIETTVGEVGHRRIMRVAADAPLRDAAQAMLDEHVHRVFVFDGEDLVGVVSSFDFVRLVADGSVTSSGELDPDGPNAA